MRLVQDLLSAPDEEGRVARKPDSWRIAITNHGLATRTGSELWSCEVAGFYSDSGHEVMLYAPVLGAVSETRASEIRVTSSVDEVVAFSPRLLHVHHYPKVRALVAALEETRPTTVNMIHGPLPAEELPQRDGVDRYFASSIASKTKISLLTGEPWETIAVVPNFYDERRFKPPNDESREKVALLFSSRASSAQIETLQRHLSKVGFRLDCAGGLTTVTSTPERILETYEVVFAVGRSAIEALASGCNVILWDDGVVGPAVTPANFWRCVVANFAFPAQLLPYCFGAEPGAQDWIAAQIGTFGEYDRTMLTLTTRRYLGLTNVGRVLLELYATALESRSAGTG